MVVAIRVESPNRKRNRYVRGREARDQRRAVASALAGFAPPTVAPLIVTLTRLSPGRLDDDNLAAALKATRDATAAWAVSDDSARGIVQAWTYAQERSDRHAVRIRIEPAPGAGLRPPPRARKPRPARQRRPKAPVRLHPVEAAKLLARDEKKRLALYRQNFVDALIDTMEADDGWQVARHTLIALNAKTSTGRVLVELPRARNGFPADLDSRLVVARRTSPVPRWDRETEYVSLHVRYHRKGQRTRTQGCAVSLRECPDVAGVQLRLVVDSADLTDAARAELLSDIERVVARVAELVPPLVPPVGEGGDRPDERATGVTTSRSGDT